MSGFSALLPTSLALGASVGWGISDFLGGLKGRSLPLLAVLLVSQGTALALLTLLVASRGEPPPEPSLMLSAAAAGLGESMAVAALYRGLARGSMSIVAPIANVAPVIPLAVSFTLGEVPSRVQIAGMGLVVVGVVLTSRHPPSATEPRPRAASSVAYGLLSAVGFGTFFVGMDAASEGSIPWALFIARLTAVVAVVLVAIAARFVAPARIRLSKSELPALAGIGVLIVSADASYAVASTQGLLGIVAVLAALHPLVTVGLARIHLGEHIARVQYVGIATCLCGVIAITVP